MSNFDNYISNVIIEATPPVPGSPTVTPPVPSSPTVTSTSSDVLKPDDIYKKLITKADRDLKDPGTTLARDGVNLVQNFLFEKGLRWKNKDYWSSVPKKNLDSVTAKYVDIGSQMYNILNIKTPAVNENFENIVNNPKLQEALKLINNFTQNTNISMYQCQDPLLKNISEVDDLAEIALSTFNKSGLIVI